MSRYAIKGSEFSSHSALLRLLGEGHGKPLLDIGCADGTMSAAFASRGWKVTGIEPYAADAQVARERGITVLEMTLEDALTTLHERFDAIVLADVLEHCADPWTQLRQLASLCDPAGRIVISLPNVAHAVPRLRLLAGRFNYEERGIMDRTHLRFFTRRTAIELVDSAGLRCEALAYTPTPLELLFPSLEQGRWGRTALAANARMARALPTLLGYQFLMVCRPT